MNICSFFKEFIGHKNACKNTFASPWIFILLKFFEFLHLKVTSYKMKNEARLGFLLDNYEITVGPILLATTYIIHNYFCYFIKS